MHEKISIVSISGGARFPSVWVLFAFFCWSTFAEESRPATPALQLVESEHLLMIAHRGYSGAAPENTLVAFDLAIRAESDLVELDYYHSKDGIPVVFHDRTLDRTTNAREIWPERDIPVRSKTLSELRQLDAGSWFDPLFKGMGIPTLEEALDLIQPRSVTLVERKEGDARTCVDLLREKDLLGDVVVQAFDWEFIKQCHELAPELVLGALGPPGSRGGQRLSAEERWLNDDFLDEIADTGARVVVWNRQVTSESVASAHKRGFQVWIYTINDPETAIELVEMGVNGIITDFPTRLWRGIALDGMRTRDVGRK